MKSLLFKSRLFIFFLLLFVSSCSKKEFLPDLKGNLVGYVYLLDEFKTEALAENNRVSVKAFGMEDTYDTYSDNNGRFEFKNLPAGTYELHFMKDGYGTLKQFDIKHLGGEPTVLNSIFDHTMSGSAYVLHAIPATEITELKIENDSIFCRFSFTGTKPEFLNIQLYISTVENFELKSADFVFTNLSLKAKGDVYYGPLGYSVGYGLHPGIPFKTGQKVFLKACACPFYSSYIRISNKWSLYGIDTYFDYVNNQIVYPVLGKESAQTPYIVP